MRLARPLLFLVLIALAAPRTDASISRAAAPGLAPANASRPIERFLTLDETSLLESRFDLFAGNELVSSTNDHAQSFHPLAAVSLLAEDARLELAPEPGASYPKTRVWAFEVLGSTLVTRSSELSLETHWACGDFSCGLASSGRKDPLGLAVVPRNPTASEWAQVQQDADFGNDRPDAMPSRGEASIGGAFRKHASEVGVVVGGMAVTAATEAVIYYTEGKAAELGIRIVIKVGGRLTTKFARTIQEAVKVARDEGSSNIRYVQERGAAAPSLSASGTRFEVATSGARDVRFYPSDQSYRAPNGTFVSPRGVPSPGTTRAREFADFLKSKEMDVVGTEMEVEGPAGTRRYDLVVRDAQGALHGIEVKTGTATKDAYQDFTDFFVNRFGATGRGRISGERVTSVTTVFLP